jgi:hypothetical protein
VRVGPPKEAGMLAAKRRSTMSSLSLDGR